MIDSDTLIRYIRIFSDLTNQLKYATQKRVLLEVTLIKLCRPAMDQNKDALLDRIRAIEAARRGRGKHRSETASYMHRMQKSPGEPKPKPELPPGIERRCESGGKRFPDDHQ